MSAVVPSRFQQLLVISPHCDDAVFACGDLLAAHPGATVVTVFAGDPAPDSPLTTWDEAAGFQPGDEVMALRRQEDARALSVLNAIPWWLPFHDHQYGIPATIDDIVHDLLVVIHTVRPHAVFIPWGLFHSDHRLASDAMIELLEDLPTQARYFYEDALYRHIPDLLVERIAALRIRGIHARRLSPASLQHHQRKQKAVACYRSQLKALTTPGRLGLDDTRLPERYWWIDSVRYTP